MVALPVSVMEKRRSSVPLAALLCGAAFGSGVASLASTRPPVVTTSRSTSPVARMTSTLPAGTDSAGADGLAVAGAASPGRSPARITGGLPV